MNAPLTAIFTKYFPATRGLNEEDRFLFTYLKVNFWLNYGVKQVIWVIVVLSGWIVQE